MGFAVYIWHSEVMVSRGYRLLLPSHAREPASREPRGGFSGKGRSDVALHVYSVSGSSTVCKVGTNICFRCG